MCSRACECDPTKTSEGRPPAGPSYVCKKCHSPNPFIIMEKIHVHCKECFVEACRKKFRATLGRSKMLSHGDRVLVAHSGGQASTMLLDLIQHSLQCDQHRQLKFLPTVMHVDCGVILKETPTARASRINEILGQVSRSYPEWRVLWTTLEAASNLVSGQDPTATLYEEYSPACPVDENNSLICNKAQSEKFLTRLMPNQDMTAQVEFIQRSLRQSLQSVAQLEFSPRQSNNSGSDYIFVGSTSSQLATNLMIDVILGQGGRLQSCVGFSDGHQRVATLRPLREFSKKEVAFYLIARRLTFQTEKSILTFSDRKSSIQRTTEAFLSQLYVDYPATYNTLLRTGNKMQV